MSVSTTIDRQRSGKYRLRIRRAGKRRTVGMYETRTEAERISVVLRQNYRLTTGHTLATLGAEVLDYRETVRRIASIENERSMWRNNVLDARFACIPIEAVKRADIRKHLETKLASGASKSAVDKALRLIRATMSEAVEREILKSSPVPPGDFRLRVPVVSAESANSGPSWTFLERDEQITLLSCTDITPARRIVYCVALYTGARLSEIKAMQWRDLDLDSSIPRWRLSSALRARPSELRSALSSRLESCCRRRCG